MAKDVSLEISLSAAFGMECLQFAKLLVSLLILVVFSSRT